MKTLIAAAFGFVTLVGSLDYFGTVAATEGLLPRIAYEQCAPDPNIWEVVCNVHVVAEGSVILAAPGLAPKWSPDGSRVAFTGIEDVYGNFSYQSWEVVVADLANGTVANVSNHPAADFSPSWSPDGRIAFVSNRDGWLELYVVNGDGSNLTRATAQAGVLGAFDWSPAGGRIAFESDRDGNPELYVVDADGSNLTRVTYGFLFRGAAVWSRDGERLAFACEVETGNADLCTIKPDGTNLTRVTTDPASDSEPAFSPLDGRIAFSSSGRIAVARVDGSVSLIGAEGTAPVWSPDGGQLAFIGTTVTMMGRCYPEGGAHNADDFCGPVSDIYVVNVDGTGLSLIANGANIDWFTPPVGSPVAAFAAECSGSACEFDASASHDSGGTIARLQWQFGDGTSGSGATSRHTYSPGAWYVVTLTVTDDGGAVGVLSKRVHANAAPHASFTVACQENTCTFDGTGSFDPDGSIVQYAWSFGDGGGAYSAVATHTYASTGIFTVRLEVSDNAGDTDNRETLVDIASVNAPPIAAFTSSCTHLACSFDASGSSDSDGAIASYAWKFGDATTAFGMTASHEYAAGGTYQVTLTVGDDNGATSTHTATLTIVPPYLHVGDLDGSRTTQQNTWTAVVTITVHDETHALVSGATVSGSWNDGSAASCTTAANGQCAVSKPANPKKPSSVNFTIVDVVRAPSVFQRSSSHDPDGDSNGHGINVSIAR